VSLLGDGLGQFDRRYSLSVRSRKADSRRRGYPLRSTRHQDVVVASPPVAGRHYPASWAQRFSRRFSRSRDLLLYGLLEQAVIAPPAPFRSIVVDRKTSRGVKRSG
jgi:hypothetical protein